MWDSINNPYIVAQNPLGKRKNKFTFHVNKYKLHFQIKSIKWFKR